MSGMIMEPLLAQKENPAQNARLSPRKPSRNPLSKQFYKDLWSLYKIAFVGGWGTIAIIANILLQCACAGLSFASMYYSAGIVGAVLDKQTALATRLFLLSISACLGQAFLQTIACYIGEVLRVGMRSKINQHMFALYFRTNVPARMKDASSKGLKIDNIDQRLSQDVELLTRLMGILTFGAYSNSFSVFSTLANALVSIYYITYISWTASMIAVIFALIAFVMSGLLALPVYRSFLQSDIALGDLRAGFSRVAECAEEIALWRGHTAEKLHLQDLLSNYSVKMLRRIFWEGVRDVWSGFQSGVPTLLGYATVLAIVALQGIAELNSAMPCDYEGCDDDTVINAGAAATAAAVSSSLVYSLCTIPSLWSDVTNLAGICARISEAIGIITPLSDDPVDSKSACTSEKEDRSDDNDDIATSIKRSNKVHDELIALYSMPPLPSSSTNSDAVANTPSRFVQLQPIFSTGRESIRTEQRLQRFIHDTISLSKGTLARLPEAASCSIALVGPSGCGKTSFLRHLVGLSECKGPSFVQRVDANPAVAGDLGLLSRSPTSEDEPRIGFMALPQKAYVTPTSLFEAVSLLPSLKSTTNARSSEKQVSFTEQIVLSDVKTGKSETVSTAEMAISAIADSLSTNETTSCHSSGILATVATLLSSRANTYIRDLFSASTIEQLSLPTSRFSLRYYVRKLIKVPIPRLGVPASLNPLYSRKQPLNRGHEETRVLQALRTMGLSHLLQRSQSFHGSANWMEELSEGEIQRLLLARVLYFRPRIAILDEPTSALDEKAGMQCLRALVSSGIQLITVSHSQTVAEAHNYTLHMSKDSLNMDPGTPTSSCLPSAISTPTPTSRNSSWSGAEDVMVLGTISTLPSPTSTECSRIPIYTYESSIGSSQSNDSNIQAATPSIHQATFLQSFCQSFWLLWSARPAIPLLSPLFSRLSLCFAPKSGTPKALSGVRLFLKRLYWRVLPPHAPILRFRPTQDLTFLFHDLSLWTQLILVSIAWYLQARISLQVSKVPGVLMDAILEGSLADGWRAIGKCLVWYVVSPIVGAISRGLGRCISLTWYARIVAKCQDAYLAPPEPLVQEITDSARMHLRNQCEEVGELLKSQEKSDNLGTWMKLIRLQWSASPLTLLHQNQNASSSSVVLQKGLPESPSDMEHSTVAQPTSPTYQPSRALDKDANVRNRFQSLRNWRQDLIEGVWAFKTSIYTARSVSNTKPSVPVTGFDRLDQRLVADTLSLTTSLGALLFGGVSRLALPQVFSTLYVTTRAALQYGALPIICCYAYTLSGVFLCRYLLIHIPRALASVSLSEGVLRSTLSRTREYTEEVCFQGVHSIEHRKCTSALTAITASSLYAVEAEFPARLVAAVNSLGGTMAAYAVSCLIAAAVGHLNGYPVTAMHLFSLSGMLMSLCLYAASLPDYLNNAAEASGHAQRIVPLVQALEQLTNPKEREKMINGVRKVREENVFSSGSNLEGFHGESVYEEAPNPLPHREELDDSELEKKEDVYDSDDRCNQRDAFVSDNIVDSSAITTTSTSDSPLMHTRSWTLLLRSAPQNESHDAVALPLPKGSLSVLHGGSGCGKSSLLRGVFEQDMEEEITYGARVAISSKKDLITITPSLCAIAENVSETERFAATKAAQSLLYSTVFSPQTVYIAEARDVLENVIYPDTLPVSDLQRERAMDCLRKVGLSHLLERLEDEDNAKILVKARGTQLMKPNSDASTRLKTLSGGEQQRLMLARVLYRNASFMILDDPFSSLDFEWRKRCTEILGMDLHDSDRCALLLTTNVSL